MDKLLLIDDEADVQYSFRRIFDSPEIELTTASSGEEGLKLLARSRPDLVIMDVRNERSGNAAPHPADRRQTSGDHDDCVRHHADGDRSDETGRVRLSAQTVRRAEIEATGGRGAQSRARYETGGVVSATAGIGRLRPGHCGPQRVDAERFQADRPTGRFRRDGPHHW